MKWVTHERAKVDRIACPWLITHFVDKNAEFLFVPKEKVAETAKTENEIPYDTPRRGVDALQRGWKRVC